MDGVIYHGNRILPGVEEFIRWLHDEKKDYLFLTNNSGSACVPVAISMGATSARQAGAIPFSIGPKPNPLMMRTGLRLLNCHSNEAVMVGDRMDTDVISGIRAARGLLLQKRGSRQSAGVKVLLWYILWNIFLYSTLTRKRALSAIWTA